jgi:hypothetical protein
MSGTVPGGIRHKNDRDAGVTIKIGDGSLCFYGAADNGASSTYTRPNQISANVVTRAVSMNVMAESSGRASTPCQGRFKQWFG